MHRYTTSVILEESVENVTPQSQRLKQNFNSSTDNNAPSTIMPFTGSNLSSALSSMSKNSISHSNSNSDNDIATKLLPANFRIDSVEEDANNKQAGSKKRSVTFASENAFSTDEFSNNTLKFHILCSNFFQGISIVISTSWNDIKHANIRMQCIKLKILASRSFYRLLYRRWMIAYSTFTILYLALIFGWILGVSTNDAQTVTGLIGIGTLCIILTNLQFVFWQFSNNQVRQRNLCLLFYSVDQVWACDTILYLHLFHIFCFFLH